MIVAETLEQVKFPIDTILQPGPPRPAAAVARAMAAGLEPEEVSCPVPSWLRPGQGRALKRLIHAMMHFRGAILADPVGSGKTYVALAAAKVCNGRSPTCCIIPPILEAQWRDVARRFDVPIHPWSEALLSRGRLPDTRAGLVIVDESHHFRNPTTKRYQTLAPWISGRPVLMLSATPIVNKADDLVHQLNLAVRDDALAAYGLGSLFDGVRNGEPHPALGRLIVLSPLERTSGRPKAMESTWQPAQAYPGTANAIIADLVLSNDAQTAALIRGVFWRSLASSPEALSAVGARYRQLLEHARDAVAAGRVMGRSALKELTIGLPDQLLMWSLFDESSSGDTLPLGDLDMLSVMLNRLSFSNPSDDPKLDQLERLTTDGRRTLVFTGFKATVHYICRHLTGANVAWCTGSDAGIGEVRTTREEALGAFRSDGRDMTSRLRPTILITTDVLAEGLDIQAAERVVHYDLPWNEVRLEQRNGRAVRGGSRHASVEVVRFLPPPYLEKRLAILETLTHKSRIAEQLGLGAGRRERWRWRAAMAATYGSRPPTIGTAGIAIEPAGILAALSVRGSRVPRPHLRGAGVIHQSWFPAPLNLLSTIVWIGPDGSWTEDPGLITDRIERAILHETTMALEPSDITGAVRRVGTVSRVLVDRLQRGRWTRASPQAGLRPLAEMLRTTAVDAARRRDTETLQRLDQALEFLAGGHTAGERSLISSLAQSRTPVPEAMRFPEADPPRRPLGLDLMGMIVFRP